MKKGKQPKERKLGKVANQWQNTPQQNLFMELYLNPNSPSFGNAYKSAIESGYSKSYAVQITSPAKLTNWIQEYPSKSNVTVNHLKEVLINIIKGNIDSKSKTDTQIKAIELLAKLDGHMVERKQIAQVIKVELGNANKEINQL